MTIFRRLGVNLSTAALAWAAVAPIGQAHAQWQPPATIDAAVTQAVGQAGLPVDPRLRVPQCRTPLIVERGADMAVIRCAAPAWRLRVPLGAKPSNMTGDAVAGAADIIVKRGDPVVVAIAGTGFAVEASGVADGDARTGERVRVKLRADAAPIIAVAIEPGRVAAR